MRPWSSSRGRNTSASVTVSVQLREQLKYQPPQSKHRRHPGADKTSAESPDTLCLHRQDSTASHTADTMGSPHHCKHNVTTDHDDNHNGSSTCYWSRETFI